jgi:hypothetical protein
MSLQLLQGPAEDTKEHSALESTMGFSYQQVLGELIYAYVVCGLDIGFAVTFLTCFAATPALGHYQALKSACKYLWATKAWGLHYWRLSQRNDLLLVKAPDVAHDPMLPVFPRSKLATLVAYVDASYAVDLKTRKSVTSLSVCYAGGCIAHKSKLRVTVATLSTEAEFKIAKYLHYVLQDRD